MINGLPETEEELNDIALTANKETNRYGLPNGLLVEWTRDGAKIVGRWDPQLGGKAN